MHELQEEYLVVVRYDVKSFAGLVQLKYRLQRVDEELCKVQKEMYRNRALQKRSCKTAENLEFFEASEDDYRERLEQIKLQKKDNQKKLKAEDTMAVEPSSNVTEETSFDLEMENDEVRESGKIIKLPDNKADYMRMSVAEKVRCYPLDDKGTDTAFEMVRTYFEKIGMDTDFDCFVGRFMEVRMLRLELQ